MSLSKHIIYTFVLFFILSFDVNAQSWYQVNSIPGPNRHHPICFSIDGIGYLLCGNADQDQTGQPFLRDFYSYDPANDQWIKKADFPGTPRGFGVGLEYRGKGYAGFGYGNNRYLDDLWEYDPQTNRWTQLPSCPCAGRTHPAFVAGFGKIYVGLGGTGRNADDWWSYDIESRQWQQEQTFPGAARHHPYYFSIDQIPYVGFGHSGPPTVIHNDFYKFDPITGEWEQMNDFPSHGRVAGTHFDHLGKGYILAGDGADHGYDVGEFWEYDPLSDTWLQLPTFPADGRWAPGCFDIDGTVYFTSGFARNTRVLHNDLWGFDLNITTRNDGVEEDFFTAFPNPTQGALNVSGTQDNDVYELFDLNGKKIMTLTATELTSTIDLSSFQSGIYFLKLKRGKETISSQRIVKL